MVSVETHLVALDLRSNTREKKSKEVKSLRVKKACIKTKIMTELKALMKVVGPNT